MWGTYDISLKLSEFTTKSDSLLDAVLANRSLDYRIPRTKILRGVTYIALLPDLVSMANILHMHAGSPRAGC